MKDSWLLETMLWTTGLTRDQDVMSDAGNVSTGWRAADMSEGPGVLPHKSLFPHSAQPLWTGIPRLPGQLASSPGLPADLPNNGKTWKEIRRWEEGRN